MQRPNVHQPIGLEALEPRALFSTYLYNSLGDAFDVGRAVLEIGPPDGALGFGTAVVGLGDINADGHDDFAVSAPGDITGTPNGAPGSVFVYSGQNGSLLRTLTDGAAGFGMALANVGDLDDDGVDDLLVGSAWSDATADAAHNPTGAAYVYSGADGSVIFSLTGTTVFGEFGRVVAASSDFDGDGTNDFAIGAPAGGASGAGQVLVVSGADFGVLRTLEGTTPGERFGAAIGASVTPPGANEPRIFVGSPEWNNATGRVSAFRTDGTLAHAIEGAEEGERFGAAIALARRAGLVAFIGAPGADDARGQFGDAIQDRGRVDVFAANSTTVLNEFLGTSANERLGESVTVAGDYTSDGADDLIVTTPGDARRPIKYLASFSAFDWNLREDPGAGLYLTSPAILAGAFATAGDVNDDGFADILSATTADGGRVSIVSAFALGDPITVDAVSPDLSRILAHTNSLRILFTDGVGVPLEHVVGLPVNAHIQALQNDGTIVFYTTMGARTELLFLTGGSAITLSDRVTTLVGGQTPAYETFVVAGVNADGDLALHDAAGRAWVFQDGTLSFLWHGTIVDINAGGAVVGSHDDAPAIWRPVGGEVAVTGLERVGAINDLGQVIGVIPGTRTNDNPGTLGVWRDGTVTEHTAGPQIPNSTGEVVWVIRDFDNEGRVLADADVAQVRTVIHLRISYLFEPGEGFREIGAVPYGVPVAHWEAEYFVDPQAPSMPLIAFGPEGEILAHNALLRVIDDALPFTMREGSPIANLEFQGVSYVVGVNIYGDVMAFASTPETWTASRLTGGFSAADGVGVAAAVDPGELGGPFAIVADYDSPIIIESLRVFRLGETPEGNRSTGTIRSSNGQTPIVGGLTVFTNAVGIVHVAGSDARGDAVIYFRSPQSPFTSSTGWIYDNLTRTHLEPQGLATPGFVGSFTAFATPWQGMHINGLDEQGNVHSIWWAPGQTLWRIDNLSVAVPGDAGPLRGQITSFATSWGTLHVNAIDSEGALVALWWAPGFGGAWRRDALVADGVALDASSLTSYTTAWGGLNIAGRDATTNQVVVYWWSPESNVWTDEPLVFRNDAASPALTGRLSASVGEDGTMALSAVGADTHAYRFSWHPGDAGEWSLEDLTELAT